MIRKVHKSTGFLIILIIICAIIGSFLGDILTPYLPEMLVQSFNVGVGPFTINLKALNITFGCTINMNFMSILGIIAAVIIYKVF